MGYKEQRVIRGSASQCSFFFIFIYLMDCWRLNALILLIGNFVGNQNDQAYDGGVWGVVSASLLIVISLSDRLSGK